jgi:hypothetical protein
LILKTTKINLWNISNRAVVKVRLWFSAAGLVQNGGTGGRKSHLRSNKNPPLLKSPDRKFLHSLGSFDYYYFFFT